MTHSSCGILSLEPFSAPDSILFLLESALSESSDSPPPATTLGWISLLSPLCIQPHDELKPYQEKLSLLLSRLLSLAFQQEAQRSHHVWPARLQEESLELSTYDSEFMAALLIELGASPWHDVSQEHPLGTALPAAMGQAWTGLCERMWAIEAGRPSLEALQVGRPEGIKKSIRTWLDWASEHPQGDDLVRWLLKAGVRSARGNHALAFASTLETFQAYQELGCLPQTPAEQKKVVTAWESRLSKGELTGAVVTELKKALSETTSLPLPEDSHVALTLIQNALSWSAWNQLKREKSPTLHSPQDMVKRAEIVRGTHAGTWSLLAAVLLKEVRPGWTGSVGRTDINWIVDGPVREDYYRHGSYLELKHDWQAMRGSLAAAKDFDWQPGISINGSLSISLSAYTQDRHEHHLSALCGALDIDDFWPWWDENVTHAAAFSEILSNRLDNANERMKDIWRTLFSQKPDLLGNNEQAALHLLRMYQRQHTPYRTEKSVDIYQQRVPNSPVTYSLEGQTYTQSGAWFHTSLLALMEHKPLTVDWLVELALWEGPGQGPWVNRLNQVASEGRLEKHHLERIKNYVNLSLKRAVKDEKEAASRHAVSDAVKQLKPWADAMARQIKSWELAFRLPKAASTTTRARF